MIQQKLKNKRYISQINFSSYLKIKLDLFVIFTDLDCLLVEVMMATEYRARHGAMLNELLKEAHKSAKKQNTTAACN